MDFTEKEQNILEINTVETLNKMKTFIKRGNINSPRNWLLKSNLSSAFQDLFKNVESVGFVRVQALVEPFMKKEEYRDILLKDLEACIFRGNNSQLAVSKYKILGDESYQNEKNVTPRFKEILKSILIDHKFDVLVKQKELLKESYELSVEKFNSSKSKNKEPVNPENYKLKGFDYYDFYNLVTLFGSKVFEEADKRNLVKDILSMDTGYYLDPVLNSDLFSRGNIAQAIFIERFLTKSFAKMDRTPNNYKKAEDLYSVVLDKFLESPGVGKIIDEKKMHLGTIIFRNPFDDLPILDKDLLNNDFQNVNNTRFKDIKLSAVVELLLISCSSENGLECIAKSTTNNDFDLSTTNVLSFWEALNSLNSVVKSNDIKNYLTFLSFRAIQDQEFSESYIERTQTAPQFKEKKKIEIENFLNNTLTSEEQLKEIKELLISYNVISTLKKCNDYNKYETEEVDGVMGRPQKIAEILATEQAKYKDVVTPGILNQRILKNMNSVTDDESANDISNDISNDNGSVHFKI